MANHDEADAVLDEITAARLSRRSLLKRAALLGLSTPAMVGLLAACRPETEAQPGEQAPAATPPAEAPAEGRRGGRLVVAMTGQPPSLDMHQVEGGRPINLICWHMFESLFTWDAEYVVTPLLAESYEASEDATTHMITLRQGVPFHNGQTMIATDVIASLERWAELSPLGRLLFGATEELVELDQHTIEFRTTPIATVPQLLARGTRGAAIYPKSVVEAAGTDFVQEYIGTGPYQFVEFLADRHTLLTRFEDYVSPPGEPNGYAGSKAAYLDEIEFRPVPDEGARFAGLQAGDFHYVEELIADQIEALRDDPNVVVEMLPPRSYGYIGLNHDSGPMSDLKIRQAALAAMSIYEQGLASHGEGFFELGPGIMLPVTVWGDSQAGAELYNQANPEKARQLLEEAGYDGTPIRWLTTQDDLGDYNSAVVCQQQLEAGGFVVELVVVDEATVATERSKREGWDIWNGAIILRTDPTLLPFLASCDWAGFWCSPEKEAAFERLLTETEFATRYAAFEELQRLFYEEVGGIKQQNNFGILAKRASLQNFSSATTHFELEPEFTNCWLEDA